MKRALHIAAIVIVMALLFWIGCAAVDYFFSAEGSFAEWLITAVPQKNVIARSMGVLFIAVAGVVMGVYCARGLRVEYGMAEEGCRAVMDAVNDAILIFDVESLEIIDITYKTFEMFGYTPAEIRTISIDQISSGKTPYSLEYAKRWIRKALTEGPQTIEWLCRDKRGKLFWAEVMLKTVIIEGTTRLVAIVRDITKHKDAEKAYEESEKKYRAVFAASPVAIALIEQDGRIVEINDRLLEWLGFEASEIMGSNVRDLPFLGNEDRKKVIGALDKRMHGERVPPYEVTFASKRGDEVACEIHAELLRAEEDEVLCEIAMIVNVTDRKRAEAALVASEKKYRAMFETSPEAIVVLDTRGFVKDVNGRIVDMLGFTPDEVRGKHLLRVPVLTMASRIKGLKALLKRVGGKDIPPYELEFVTKAGERRIGLIHAKELKDEAGTVAGDLVLISDVTERRKAEDALRRSEENFRRLFDESNDAIFIHDLKGKILDVNEAACAMLGYSKDALLKITIPQLHPPEDLPTMKWAIAAVHEKGAARFEAKFVKSDGSMLDVDISARTVDEKMGIVQGIARDITGRRRTPDTQRTNG